MLRLLRVENFALIQQLQIEFADGLNILTGETGAGKSILIDAVQAVLGSRTSTDLIRTGTNAAYIEAVFETQGQVDSLMVEWGWELEEDGLLVISRRITQQGKSHCLINGRTVTQTMLRQVGDILLDIHGQHDHQSLLHPEQHSELLDLFGGEELLQQRMLVSEGYKKWRELTKQLNDRLGGERERAQRLDIIQFQCQEIAAAKLKPDEDSILQEEWRVLAHAEKLKAAADDAYQLLYGADRSRGAVLDNLEIVVARLREISKVDKNLDGTLAQAEGTLYQLQEISREVAAYKEHIDADPARLQAVHTRLDLIERLQKKYGSTVEEIVLYHSKLNAELESVENNEHFVAALQTEVAAVHNTLAGNMDRLTVLRKNAADQMVEMLHRELTDLGMKQANFSVNFGTAALGLRGQDRVEFMFSANPGEEPRALAKIISGGEMSRVMLALKTVLANVDQIDTVIFDEIDTGIGGRAAQSVAEKLSQIAAARQVLCITHLPQIACMADRHLLISKQVEGDRTYTEITPLTEGEQQEELARMMGGAQLTDTTLQHALEMLELAQKQKKSWKN